MSKNNTTAQRANAGHAIKKRAKVAPRKARLVIDQIRGMGVVQAMAILDHTRRSSNPIVLDLLKSAVANALQKNGSLNPDELIVTEARVDQAPMLKRMRPRAMGRGMQIQKKNSHIILAVG